MMRGIWSVELLLINIKNEIIYNNMAGGHLILQSLMRYAQLDNHLQKCLMAKQGWAVAPMLVPGILESHAVHLFLQGL